FTPLALPETHLELGYPAGKSLAEELACETDRRADGEEGSERKCGSKEILIGWSDVTPGERHGVLDQPRQCGHRANGRYEHDAECRAQSRQTESALVLELLASQEVVLAQRGMQVVHHIAILEHAPQPRQDRKKAH